MTPDQFLRDFGKGTVGVKIDESPEFEEFCSFIEKNYFRLGAAFHWSGSIHSYAMDRIKKGYKGIVCDGGRKDRLAAAIMPNNRMIAASELEWPNWPVKDFLAVLEERSTE